MSITKETILALKGLGFLRNRGTDCFSGRVVSAGGVYTVRELKAISECAEKYGNGKVAFTSRQAAEIVGIPADRTDEAIEFLAAYGLFFGGTGARVRPITACKGTTCVFGNLDTQALAKSLHDRFYLGMHTVTLPHKFKIGIGGCPNSCMKPSLNDVGIEAHVSFSVDKEACRACKVCAVAAACRSGAVRLDGGRASVDPALCRSCGLCLGKCPFGAFPKSAMTRCLITVGGTWGKIRRDGTPLPFTLPTEGVGDAVETILLWYRENGYVGERLGTTVDRVGIESLSAAIQSSALLARREEILGAPLKKRPEAAK